jgi:hypothetical protein
MDAMNHLKAKYGDPPWLAYPNATGTPAIHQVVNKAFAALGKHRLARRTRFLIVSVWTYHS